MNRIFCLIILTMLSHKTNFAQADSLQQQINQPVWKPFIESFNSLDTKGFMGVHSKELSRVIQDGNLIYGYDRYYQEMEQGNERTKKADQKRSIDASSKELPVMIKLSRQDIISSPVFKLIVLRETVMENSTSCFAKRMAPGRS